MSTNYYDDLVVTTTFSVDHPNYIGKHIRGLKIGNMVLVCYAVVGLIVPFYWFDWGILSAPTAVGALIWIIFNERKMREIQQDLDREPIEVEGVVKKESQSLSPGKYPYPGGVLQLEGRSEFYGVDATFIRRISKGQKVRLIFMPKTRYVKAWQLLQEIHYEKIAAQKN